MKRIAETMGRILRRLFVLGVAPALVAAALMATSAHAEPTLFYNAYTGTGVTAFIDAGGSLTNQLVYTGFAPWTHVTSVDGGVDGVSLKGYRQALFLNVYTGKAATSRIYLDGSGYEFTRALSGFGPWTHVVGLRFSGGLVLFVNTTTGVGATGRMNSDGSFTNLKTLSGFGPWTHITGLYGGLVMFYSANLHVGVVGRVNPDGSFVSLNTISGFGTWTHVTGVGSYPQDPGLVLFVNANTGVAATVRVGSDGSFTNLQTLSGFGPWTHITGLYGGRVLFYSVNLGVGEVGVVNSDGSFTDGTVTTGFAPWLQVNGDSSDGIPGH